MGETDIKMLRKTGYSAASQRKRSLKHHTKVVISTHKQGRLSWCWSCLTTWPQYQWSLAI